MSALTVLVTGCGAPGFPGTCWSLRNNPVGRDVRIVGVDVRSEQAGRYLADTFQQVPPADDETFAEDLLAVCETEGADVVLPQVTRELPVLADHRDRFADAGVPVAVASADAVAVANDKAALIDRCEQVDVPYPETMTAETDDELAAACDALGYPEVPVVVKPPRSNGSRGMRILDPDRDHRRAFYEEKPTGVYTTLDALRSTLGDSFPELLVTEYLPGAEYTVDAFRSPAAAEATETVVVPRRREEVHAGISFRTTVERSAELRAYTDRLAADLDLGYAFGFQFKRDSDGQPKILECNPRVQGTMVAATMAGANVVYAAVAAAAGEPIPAMVPEWECTFHRYWGGVGTVEGSLVGNVGDL